MSTKEKWRKSFQKTRSISQTSLDLKNSSSLLDEDDLSVSDSELEKYLGTLKNKSGVGRLWMGNTFGRVIDRTPDVSISSVSDGEAPNSQEESQPNNDDDFRPKLLGLSETEDNHDDKKSDVSEPSSIKPLEAINMISDLEELSEGGPIQFNNNVKFSANSKELDTSNNVDVKSITNDLSKIEEVHTLDEVSEDIEEDLNTINSEHTLNEGDSKASDNKKSRRKHKSSNNSNHESSHGGNTTHKSTTSRHHKKDGKISRRSSKSHEQSVSQSHHSDSKRKSSRKSSAHKPSKRSDRYTSYSTDFSDTSKQKTVSDESDDEGTTATSYTASSVSRTREKSPQPSSKSRKPSKTNHRDNISHHDVATQVDLMDTVKQHQATQLPAVGMATLGPSRDSNRNVDPSPIAAHVVGAEQIEALTAHNPAIVALTNMLREQLRLVEQYVDNSRRMYESYTQNLNTTYKYTTLEDTIQYLERHDQENRHRKSRTEHDDQT